MVVAKFTDLWYSAFFAMEKQHTLLIKATRERQCAENYNKWRSIIFLNCNQNFGNFKP